MIKGLMSLYGWRYPETLVYMLQSNEYEAAKYIAWFWQTTNFNNVAHRKTIDKTKAARMLIAVLRLGILAQVSVAVFLYWRGLVAGSPGLVVSGIILALSYPIIWSHAVVVPLILGKLLIIAPNNRRLVTSSKSIFHQHKATKIAVAGSYGKTTMKEILRTILAEGLNVKATPANKNVAVSHAIFARSLEADDQVIIVEFGEGKPGDVAAFSKVVKPDIGVITGLAPAHLDKYKTLENAGKDIFSLGEFVKPENLFVNIEPKAVKPFVKHDFQTYSRQGVDGWQVSDVVMNVSGTAFKMKKAGKTLVLQTSLVGEHLLASLACAVAIAKRLGLSDDQIKAGVAKTEPFEHRMQPRPLAGGWVIDDTYNGTIDGMQAGLRLLASLPANRRVYVTPGLVDQGRDTHKIHVQLGKLIAEANPDKTVLMKNSVTEWILNGLHAAGYKGTVLVQDDPLEFYTNIDQIIAAGDVVMLQNDWPDNYK